MGDAGGGVAVIDIVGANTKLNEPSKEGFKNLIIVIDAFKKDGLGHKNGAGAAELINHADGFRSELIGVLKVDGEIEGLG